MNGSNRVGREMARLTVIRSPPTPRDIMENLTGSLVFTIEVLEPVHIGGTGISIRGAGEILDQLKEAAGSVDYKIAKLREIVESRLMGRDIAEVFSLGRERYPTITGSSLKGAVRSRLELSFRGYQGKVPSCFSVSERGVFIAEKGRSGWRHQDIYPSSQEDRGGPCDYTRFSAVCKVCDIFGAPGLAARIHFPSVIFPCDPEVFNASFTGFVEVIPRGCEAEGTMAFTNLEPYELGLVLIGMGDMKPLLVGFGKYRDHPDGRMGKILIKPKEWFLLPTSSRTLRRLGIDFELRDGRIKVEANGLWRLSVSIARERYSDYWGEVRLPV